MQRLCLQHLTLLQELGLLSADAFAMAYYGDVFLGDNENRMGIGTIGS